MSGERKVKQQKLLVRSGALWIPSRKSSFLPGSERKNNTTLVLRLTVKVGSPWQSKLKWPRWHRALWPGVSQANWSMGVTNLFQLSPPCESEQSHRRPYCIFWWKALGPEMEVLSGGQFINRASWHQTKEDIPMRPKIQVDWGRIKLGWRPAVLPGHS